MKKIFSRKGNRFRSSKTGGATASEPAAQQGPAETNPNMGMMPNGQTMGGNAAPYQQQQQQQQQRQAPSRDYQRYQANAGPPPAQSAPPPQQQHMMKKPPPPAAPTTPAPPPQMKMEMEAPVPAPAPADPNNISNALNASLNLEDEAARNAITRELVKKFVSDIWNRGDLELIPEVCSPSLRFNGSVGMDRVGHDGFSRMVTTIRDALNDYHCEIHSMVVEGNKAFCRMRFTGRHTGPLLGYEPTGRQVAWMGAAEFTVKKDRILKVWELGDVKSLEEQLSGN